MLTSTPTATSDNGPGPEPTTPTPTQTSTPAGTPTLTPSGCFDVGYATQQDTRGDIETGCTGYDEQYDIHQVGATCDDEYLYFLWEVEGVVGSPADANFAFWAWLDVDDNSATGGQSGAEYLVQFAMQAGTVRGDWSGLFDATGTGWPPPQLYGLTEADYCIWGTYLEVRVPKTYIQFHETPVNTAMGVDVNFFGPGSQCMDEGGTFHIPVECAVPPATPTATTSPSATPPPETTITIDEAYTADYAGNRKSEFSDCQIFNLGFKATNHSSETLMVIFNEETRGPSGAEVPELSPGTWEEEMTPGQADFPLLQIIPNGAATGTYTYTVSAAYGSQTHQASTTFSVIPSEAPITLLDAVMTRGINEEDWHTGEVTTFAADEVVWTWSLWERGIGNHTARWQWYNPVGNLFATESLPLTTTDCAPTTWDGIEGSPNLETGAWRVDIYMDGRLEDSLNFTVVPATLADIRYMRARYR